MMVGSSRIVPAAKIVNPLGNSDLDYSEEKRLRRGILEKALSALGTEIQDQKLFSD